jgi:NAD-dependent deacetylase
MTTRQTVVEVGSEGGSIAIFRERRAGAAWEFRMGTNESAMHDMLSDEDVAGLGPAIKKSESVHSFGEALTLLDKYQWSRMRPLEVHPEYLDEVIHAVAERSGLRAAARWLVHFSGSLAVLTGAGVSAESGIPTFRSDGGYWRTHRFQDLATPEAFSRDPKLVWTWYEERRRTVALAKPNEGHYAICEMEQMKQDFTLITQNVDGLHDLAGSRNVIKLHGDIWTLRCIKCGEEQIDRSELGELPPRCHCGGILRPGVVWFGEDIPAGAIEQAEKAVRAADVLIVAGTSAQVYPAAGLIPIAKRVIEINPEATQFSDHVAFSLRGTSADIFPLLLRVRSGHLKPNDRGIFSRLDLEFP